MSTAEKLDKAGLQSEALIQFGLTGEKLLYVMGFIEGIRSKNEYEEIQREAASQQAQSA